MALTFTMIGTRIPLNYLVISETPAPDTWRADAPCAGVCVAKVGLERRRVHHIKVDIWRLPRDNEDPCVKSFGALTVTRRQASGTGNIPSTPYSAAVVYRPWYGDTCVRMGHPTRVNERLAC